MGTSISLGIAFTALIVAGMGVAFCIANLAIIMWRFFKDIFRPDDF